MRGGTSKGVFFRVEDLPEAARVPGPARDALLLRVIGSPDAYGKQIDGMGGATSSTSKTVLLSKSARPGHDVDYLFGQVAIDKPLRRLERQLRQPVRGGRPVRDRQRTGRCEPRAAHDGVAIVRIWQANIGKAIVAHVPMTGRRGAGDGRLRARRRHVPGRRGRARVPRPGGRRRRGRRRDVPHGQRRRPTSRCPGVGRLQVTLINAGIPTIFLDAEAARLHGHRAAGRDQRRCEGARDVRDDPRARRAAHGPHPATWSRPRTRQHTPKVAFVAKPADYVASSGKAVRAGDVDLLVRALSMGKLHHAMMGTAAVAIGTAAAIPGNAGQPRGRRRRTQRGALRPSVGHAARRRRGHAGRRCRGRSPRRS